MNLFTGGRALVRAIPRKPASPLRQRTLAGVGGKATSPHVVFYKDFGRPVAKVFLMAFFTYQVTYWAWVKLEKEEERGEKEKEVSAIEQEVVRLRADVKSRNAGGCK